MLGFVEPAEDAADLLRHRFPSKLGGRPAWLDPLRLPSPEQLTCGATGRPLDFLLQVGDNTSVPTLCQSMPAQLLFLPLCIPNTRPGHITCQESIACPHAWDLCVLRVPTHR